MIGTEINNEYFQLRMSKIIVNRLQRKRKDRKAPLLPSFGKLKNIHLTKH